MDQLSNAIASEYNSFQTGGTSGILAEGDFFEISTDGRCIRLVRLGVTDRELVIGERHKLNICHARLVGLTTAFGKTSRDIWGPLELCTALPLKLIKLLVIDDRSKRMVVLTCTSQATYYEMCSLDGSCDDIWLLWTESIMIASEMNTPLRGARQQPLGNTKSPNCHSCEHDARHTHTINPDTFGYGSNYKSEYFEGCPPVLKVHAKHSCLMRETKKWTHPDSPTRPRIVYKHVSDAGTQTETHLSQNGDMLADGLGSNDTSSHLALTSDCTRVQEQSSSATLVTYMGSETSFCPSIYNIKSENCNVSGKSLSFNTPLESISLSPLSLSPSTSSNDVNHPFGNLRFLNCRSYLRHVASKEFCGLQKSESVSKLTPSRQGRSNVSMDGSHVRRSMSLPSACRMKNFRQKSTSVWQKIRRPKRRSAHPLHKRFVQNLSTLDFATYRKMCCYQQLHASPVRMGLLANMNEDGTNHIGASGLLDFKSQAISEQLALIGRDLLWSITPSELCQLSISDVQGQHIPMHLQNNESGNVLKRIATAELRIKDRFVKAIIRTHDALQQAKAIEFFIKVLEDCWEMKNVWGCSCVLDALADFRVISLKSSLSQLQLSNPRAIRNIQRVLQLLHRIHTRRSICHELRSGKTSAGLPQIYSVIKLLLRVASVEQRYARSFSDSERSLCNISAKSSPLLNNRVSPHHDHVTGCARDVTEKYNYWLNSPLGVSPISLSTYSSSSSSLEIDQSHSSDSEGSSNQSMDGPDCRNYETNMPSITSEFCNIALNNTGSMHRIRRRSVLERMLNTIWVHSDDNEADDEEDEAVNNIDLPPSHRITRRHTFLKRLFRKRRGRQNLPNSSRSKITNQTFSKKYHQMGSHVNVVDMRTADLRTMNISTNAKHTNYKQATLERQPCASSAKSCSDCACNLPTGRDSLTNSRSTFNIGVWRALDISFRQPCHSLQMLSSGDGAGSYGEQRPGFIRRGDINTISGGTPLVTVSSNSGEDESSGQSLNTFTKSTTVANRKQYHSPRASGSPHKHNALLRNQVRQRDALAYLHSEQIDENSMNMNIAKPVSVRQQFTRQFKKPRDKNRDVHIDKPKTPSSNDRLDDKYYAKKVKRDNARTVMQIENHTFLLREAMSAKGIGFQHDMSSYLAMSSREMKATGTQTSPVKKSSANTIKSVCIICGELKCLRPKGFIECVLRLQIIAGRYYFLTNRVIRSLLTRT